MLAYGLLWFRLFDIVPIARHLLVEHMTDGVLVLDVLNRVVDVNPAALQLMRLPVSPVGRTLADLLPHWPASLVEYQHATSLQTEISVGENPVYYFDLRIVPLYSRDTHLRGRLIVFRDITQRRQIETAVQETNQRLQYQLTEIEALQSQLRDQAIRDPLTGLFNRRYLEETLGRELSRAEREATPLSIVMLDVDHFKRLNDEYGHKAGDLMLQALADLLRTHSRAGDVACRYGGEEFVMILPGAPIAVALRRAEEWRVAFEQLRLGFEGQILTRTISLGVAVYALHGATSEALMLEADAALYRAKAGGRNQVQVAGD